jgi:DNA polymerase beta
MERLTVEQCEAFRRQPSVNPLTGNVIKVGGPTFLKLVEKCEELKRKQVTIVPIRHTEEVNPNNLKPRILSELDMLRKDEIANKNTFKVRAYDKVIKGIQRIDYPIQTWDDLKHVEGIGKSIEAKIKEILRDGQLFRASEIRLHPRTAALEELMNVHGIGPTKAKELYSKGIRSIADLKRKVKEDPEIVNDVQRMGLKYVDDFLKRIPRSEMEVHQEILEEVTRGTEFVFDIVGSYRRRAESSGDIDVLLTLPEESTHKIDKFYRLIETLKKSGYLVATLAEGEKKYMGVAKVKGTHFSRSGRGKDYPARRIDLMLTPRREYPFALLYFTGSKAFNIRVRRAALEKGLSLNEYGFSLTEKGDRKRIPKIESEHQLLEYLIGTYIKPEDRV